MANKKNENQRDPSWPDWFTGQNIDEAFPGEPQAGVHRKILLFTERAAGGYYTASQGNQPGYCALYQVKRGNQDQ